jgi:hypothetical protein
MVNNTIHIERLASLYLVSRAHPAPLRIRAELDDLARAYISEGCASAFASVLDGGDPSVWVIRSLQLNLLVDVHAASPEDVARFWARQIAQGVAQVLAAGEDGDGVLRFADRPAFLAYFLQSLTEGCAWQRWYFREFGGLRSLPEGAAIREALLREPLAIDATLLELERTGRLANVTSALTRGDSRRILMSCAGSSDCTAAEWMEVVRRLSHVELPSSLLGVLARIRRIYAELDPARAARAAEHLEVILRWRSAGTLEALMDSATRASMPKLDGDPSDRDTYLLLRAVVEEQGHYALAPLFDLPGHQDSPVVTEQQTTGAGGAALLCVALVETPSLLALFGDPEQKYLLYLLLLTCFSPKLADAWREPALRMLAGISQLPAPGAYTSVCAHDLLEELAEVALPEDIAWFGAPELIPGVPIHEELRHALTVSAAALLRAFARTLPALSGSSIEYLWQNLLAGDAHLLHGADGLVAHLRPRPLQIVLRMACLHDRTVHVPWLDPPVLTIHFEQG